MSKLEAIFSHCPAVGESHEGPDESAISNSEETSRRLRSLAFEKAIPSPVENMKGERYIHVLGKLNF